MSDGKQISKHVFASLLKMNASNKSKVAEINGDFGEKLAHHKEHSNLNLPAFKFIAKMHAMEEQKRNELWSALLFLKDLADETVWSERHVGDLADMAASTEDEDGEETGDDPDEEAAAANTEALRSGISQLEDEPDEPAVAKPKRAPRNRRAAGTSSGSYRVN